MSTKKVWGINPTEFSANTLNPIRILWETKQPKGNPEKSEIHLQPGDPTLFNEFPPHPSVTQALLDAVLGDKFSYLECPGNRDARQAVAEYSQHMGNVTSDDVFLTTGCSMAIEIACRSLANPGDNILVPRPSWNYTTWIHGSGIETQHYNLDPNNEWQVDLKHLESLINDKTRAIILNSPGNPCGNVFSNEHILDILKVAEDHCLPIISDEIYEFFTIPGINHHSVASLSKNVPVLVCSGLTKRFLIPGVRLDWIIINDRGDKMTKLRKGFMNTAGRNFFPNSSVQLALPNILKSVPQSFFESNNKKIYRNGLAVFNRLKNIPGLQPSLSKGSIYMIIGLDLEKFPNINSSLEFMQLLANEQSVFTFPSECFNFPGFLRIVLTAPEEMLLRACDRLQIFCDEHFLG